MRDATSNRVPGHALAHEGAPHDEHGRPLRHLYGIIRGGEGRAKCECGELSLVLVSDAARKRWHRAHKAAVAR